MVVSNNDLDFVLDTDGLFAFTDGGPTVLIDGDPIAYSAASVCDTSIHKLYLKGKLVHQVEGGVTELYRAFSVKDKAEWDKIMANNPDITHEKAVIADDDPKQMFHTIKALIRKIIKRTGAGSVRIFLTDGASNFRLTEEIATVLKYKGNRSSEAKPQLLSEARKYMMDELGSEMCVGLEADDQLSILHYEAWERAMEAAGDFYLAEKPELELLEKKAMELVDTVLVTIDKDIKMRAGKFLNPDQDIGIEEIYPLGMLHMEIKEKKNKPPSKKLRFNGLRGFYSQILLGDDCDNISSVYFCGDVRVHDVLKDCKTEEELFKATLSEIYEGFHREHIKALDYDIDNRVEMAVANGASGSKSNIAKLRKKFKDYLLSNVQYCNKRYYHWSCYLEDEFGVVTRELIPNDVEASELSPVEYMTEVARLVFMLTVPVSEDGSHLWTPPNEQWVQDVKSKYDNQNLTRVATPWLLEREL